MSCILHYKVDDIFSYSYDIFRAYFYSSVSLINKTLQLLMTYDTFDAADDYNSSSSCCYVAQETLTSANTCSFAPAD